MDTTGDDLPAGGEDPSGVVPPNPQTEEEYNEQRRQQQQQHHHHHQQQHHNNTSQDHTGDGTTPGRIFVCRLAWTTTTAKFQKHFSKYGDITDSEIVKDWKTHHSRGYGFITYADSSVVDKVIEDNHVINGRQLEIRRALPRKTYPPSSSSSSESYNNNSRSSYGGYGDAYVGYSGSLGVGGYWSDSMYGGWSGPYGGYGSGFGGFGAYAAMGPYIDPSLAYIVPYGGGYGGGFDGGFGRGYELGRYGETSESYRAYGGGGGDAGANDFSLGGGYGGASGGPFYGSRDYGAGRYHPYGR